MKKFLTVILCALFVNLFLPFEQIKAAPSIAISASPASVAQYDKYEISFTVDGLGTAGTNYNPFNPNLATPAGADASKVWNKPGVYVDALFTKPSGGIVHWPAFWDGSKWMVRFSPREKGSWSYQILAKHSTGTSTSDKKSFTVTEAQDPRGFIKVNPDNRYTFRFDNGDTFHPIGSSTNATDNFALTEVLQAIGQNGGNYARVFQETATAIEYPQDSSTVNNYKASAAQRMDEILQSAEDNGVYIDFTLESWTRLQPIDQNPYVKAGLVSDIAGFFSNSTAQEIYKRKLRYILARWGYSTHIMGIELINETGGGVSGTSGYPQSKPWIKEMGGFIQGDATKVPSGWGGGGESISAKEQGPHLATCSNGDLMLTDKYIPWEDGSMDYINEHQYLKDYLNWSGSLDSRYSLNNEVLGSLVNEPWKDTAVLADRLARIAHKRYLWNKPISITEYAPAIKNTKDWNSAMERDKNAGHVRDAMWAGLFSGISVNHWKSAYMMGGIKKDSTGQVTADYSPSKMWIFKPMSNFFKDIKLDGMTTETAYPVADPLNASPKVVSPSANIMATAWLGTDKAYLYAKNATYVWSGVLGSDGCTTYDAAGNPLPAACGPLPTLAEPSGIIQLKGLTSGSYVLEKYSTVEQDPAKQMLETKTITVEADGIAKIDVALGKTMGTYDYAYKIHKLVDAGSIKISTISDKTSALAGDTINITDKVINTTGSSAANLTISNVLPDKTEFVSATDNGTLSTKSIPCDQAATYGRSSCTGSFDAPVVTWAAISVGANSEKTVTLTIKVVNQVTVPTTTYKNLTGNTPVQVEAEDPSAVVTAPMVIGDDPSASGGKFIHVPDNAASSGGSAVYNVDATASPGNYYLWANVFWVDTSGNSFTVQKDSNTEIILTDDVYAKPHWIKLGSALNFTGKHTLSILRREDGSQIDKFILSTDSAFDPNSSSLPAGDTQAPVVSVTSPANGASIKIRSTQTISANATDNVGVAKVEFYINGSLKLTDTSSPYSMSWSTKGLALGAYTILVKAYDAAGNVNQSQVGISLRR